MLFDNGKIINIDSLHLPDLINDQKITFYNIPIYDDYQKKDFDIAYNLLEDYDDVIDKVDPDYWYTLLFYPDSQEFIESKELYQKNEYIYLTFRASENEFFRFVSTGPVEICRFESHQIKNERLYL